MLFAVFASSVANADTTQDIERLREAVHAFTSEHYRHSLQHRNFEEDVEISVGNIDKRLRLARCDDQLGFKIQEPPHNIRNITVKTSCHNDRRWTIYVPVSIDIYSDVLVLNKSISRGEVLQEDDISHQRMNISTVGRGHIEDPTRAIGFELKRSLNAGEVIRLPYLTHPDIVRKGQIVVLTSGSRFLNIETSAVALTNGYLGETIKVKNERSNRVVDVEVTGPGKVTVAAR
ncbi:MAG: flagellar basal body P-ring formation protein FlgA [Agarilytica sp.]